MWVNLASPELTHSDSGPRSLGYSGPNMSSDLLASLEYLSGLARVSLAEVLILFSQWIIEGSNIRGRQQHKLNLRRFFLLIGGTVSIEAPYMGRDIRVADRIFDKGAASYSATRIGNPQGSSDCTDVEVATSVDGGHIQNAQTVNAGPKGAEIDVREVLDGKEVMVDNRYIKANYPLLVRLSTSDTHNSLRNTIKLEKWKGWTGWVTVKLSLSVPFFPLQRPFPSKAFFLMRHSFPDLERWVSERIGVADKQKLLRGDWDVLRDVWD
ncbi:hypothetical protein Tco_0066649 [Tanacetum coccineum]